MSKAELGAELFVKAYTKLSQSLRAAIKANQEWEAQHPEWESGEAKMLRKLIRVAEDRKDRLGAVAAEYLLYLYIVKD